MTAQEIERILKKRGLENSYRRYDIPYKKYKSKIPSDESNLKEYIFTSVKGAPYQGVSDPDQSLEQ